jgi:hypothetical protein
VNNVVATLGVAADSRLPVVNWAISAFALVFASALRLLRQDSILPGSSIAGVARGVNGDAMDTDHLTLSGVAKQDSGEEAAWLFLEEMRWPDGPARPHCGAVDAQEQRAHDTHG